MRLRVVMAEEPHPLPDCEGLLAVVRRPGELHEPFVLDHEPGERLEAQASSWGLDVSVAATLLIEAELLRCELAALGLACLASRLDASPAAPKRAMSAAEGDYLRSLTMRRVRRAAEPAVRLALPVRLHPRVNERLLQAAVAADLGQALAWEACALVQGLTIGEWGLRRGLELVAEGR